MNGALVGGFLLLAYSIYSGYQAKTDGLDWTPLLNGKVWGGGLVGLVTILVQIKPKFMAYWESLPGLEKVKTVDKIEVDTVKPDVKVPSEFDEYDITDLESEDLSCLSYLAKRAKKLNNEEALALLKTLSDKFFDIHNKTV